MDKFFIEKDRQGTCLIELKGDFKNHADVDLVIAEIYVDRYAEIICKLLNEQANKI